jgi:hypothetical protein
MRAESWLYRQLRDYNEGRAVVRVGLSLGGSPGAPMTGLPVTSQGGSSR